MQVFTRKVLNFSQGILSAETSVIQKAHGVLINNNSIFHANFTNTGRFIVSHDGAVEFQMTSEESDAGQNFAPFFDGSDVGFDSVAPISSVGLIHYTNDKDYAGYIRPTISSLNYRNLFKDKYQVKKWKSINFDKFVQIANSAAREGQVLFCGLVLIVILNSV